MTGRGLENQLKYPHFYLPIDPPLCMKLAIFLLQPKTVVIIETELWPSLINQLNCPCFLINGRLSKKSYDNYSRYSFLTSIMIKKLQGIWCVSDIVKKRFSQLGGKVFSVHPNLKYLSATINANTPQPPSAPRLVCGSTHPEEDIDLINQLPSIQKRIPGFEMIIIPRHQHRARWLKKQYHQCKGLIIEDRYGYTMSWYQKARWVFIGGSLVKHGGQNPLEPLSINRFTMMGPYFHNFTSIIEDLENHKLITIINHATDIVEILNNSPPTPTCQPFFQEQKNLANQAVQELLSQIPDF